MPSAASRPPKTMPRPHSHHLGAVEIVEIPERLIARFDGTGAPEGVNFQNAIRALYSVSFGIKFALKKRGIVTPSVQPLEALWDVRDWDTAMAEHPDEIRWTALIGQPEEATEALVAEVAREAAEEKGITPALNVRLERWTEGLCAQFLHVGPYDAEGPGITRMHDEIAARGYVMRGLHHEIYLGDPRRAAPDKLRTLIRQPIALR